MATPIKSNMQVTSGATLDAASGGEINSTHVNGVQMLSTGSGTLGKIPIDQGNGTSVWADPLISQNSVVSTSNSTVATLIGNAVYTGTSESNVGYIKLLLNVFADVASAASGLQVQQSQDGTNWDITDSWSVSASTAFQTEVALVAKFYRVKYTNGVTGQGTFRLQSIMVPVGEPTARNLSTAGNKKVAVAEALPAGSNIIGQVEVTDGSNILGTTAHPVKTDSSAVNQPVVPAVPTTMATTSAVINFSSSGDNTVVTGLSAKTIRVMRLVLVVAGATNITFKDGASTSLSGAIPMLANGSIVLDDSGEPWYLTSTANNFVINSSVAVSVQGTVWFSQS